MNTSHRTVVPAPAWALDALKARRLPVPTVTNEPVNLPGLEVAVCPFEAWLQAGGDRRCKPRPLPKVIARQ